jgi:hypothetical protein
VREDKKVPVNSARVEAVGDVEQRIKDLNQEMMRLPPEERRKRWEEYLWRLTTLTDTTKR